MNDEMPTHIWTTPDTGGPKHWWYGAQSNGTRYVRADVADDLLAALRNIAREETWAANATVKRMAATARAAIMKAEGR